MYHTKLLNLAQEYRETVGNVENRITNAEIHAERISKAKADYEKIESERKSLLTRVRQTLEFNTQTQISLQIEQGDSAGERLNHEVEQIWDVGIGRTGSELEKEFRGWDGNFGTDQELHKQGANTGAVEGWGKACKQPLAERTKFEPNLLTDGRASGWLEIIGGHSASPPESLGQRSKSNSVNKVPSFHLSRKPINFRVNALFPSEAASFVAS